MKKTKKLLPLIGSLTLLAAPVVLVSACSSEVNRYNAALPKDIQDRLLFDFIGVNYNVDAKSHFNNIYKQGMEFLKKEVEGIMAEQEFLNFFQDKLGYSEAVSKTTFEEIKDNLGLNILATEYFNTINNGQNFDNKDTTKLIFQTDNWHQFGTTRFNYGNVPYYSEHNPNNIFSNSNLYTDLDDATKDAEIKAVAKHADENFNLELSSLTANNLKWNSPTTPAAPVPVLGSDNDIQNYQKRLERFKWWLRFRYQQYYYSVILPELNQTLFTMANILDSILKVDAAKKTIAIDNGVFATQLQSWAPNAKWTSNYRLVWDYTTNEKTAININANWDATTNPTKLPELMSDNQTLNTNFLNELAGTDKTLKNSADAIFGINGFVNDTSSKLYNTQVKDATVSGWARNLDGSHYWGQNNNGTFAYTAPIYWIDVVQNLNFNFYQNQSQASQWLVSDPNQLITKWNNNPDNSTISSTNFSQYIRADYLNGDSTPTQDQYITTQEMKWNIFWQMIYWLSAQVDSNPNKTQAADNFTTAAKVLFPKFIKKTNIYNIDFWNAVSSYY
ncbi:hypothetical protein LT335_00228 [Spiroplasma sp. JKS002669]|uniref:hypothetical protein n=1 Tax=Spiroplasma attinicola TaxID=2904537 RepID=UPI0020230832|nr:MULTISPECIES: hypothetical protein [unclassified Spiroplasma]MCL6428681.1 hypothetical protein [Spiroplasma sp. JKS002669]MCL8210032.1 hypothetical protein [Spiroplasma sp. JKS002670]